jgi:lipopolysaccharide/colanic/teichoic acid biosynthesis glycosyltransferase
VRQDPESTRRGRFARQIKNVLDRTCALAALVALSPLLAALALAVRIDVGSPVLFRQRRPGQYGWPFVLLKFRTMRAGKGPDQARLTRLGQFLRTTSLDELPELVNVLRGDMSLVGPRPLLMSYLELYDSEEARRHEVRPGITGWAQINGRNEVPWSERLRMDVWYVDHWSLALDLRILALTVLTVLSRRGISAPGEATMSEFRGSGREAGLSSTGGV